MSSLSAPKPSRVDYEIYAKERREDFRSKVKEFTENPFPPNFVSDVQEPHLFDRYRYSKQRDHELQMEEEKKERERLYQENKKHLDDLIAEANRFLQKRGKLSDLREALIKRDAELQQHERDILREKMSTVTEQQRLLSELTTRGRDQMGKLDRMIEALENAVAMKTKQINRLQIDDQEDNRMILDASVFETPDHVHYSPVDDHDPRTKNIVWEGSGLADTDMIPESEPNLSSSRDANLEEFEFDYMRLIDPQNPWNKISVKEILSYPGIHKSETVGENDEPKILERIIHSATYNRLGLFLSNYLRRNYHIYTVIDVPVFLNAGISRSGLRLNSNNPFFDSAIVVNVYDQNYKKQNAEATISSPPIPQTFLMGGNKNFTQATCDMKFIPFTKGKDGVYDMEEWTSSSDSSVVYYVVIGQKVGSKDVDYILRAFHGVKNIFVIRHSDWIETKRRQLAFASYCHTKLFHYKTYCLNQCINMQKNGSYDDVSNRGCKKKGIENAFKSLREKRIENDFRTFVQKICFPYPVYTGLSLYNNLFNKTIPKDVIQSSRGDPGIQIIQPWIARDLFYTLACGFGTHFVCIAGLSQETIFNYIKEMLKKIRGPESTEDQQKNFVDLVNSNVKETAKKLRPAWTAQIDHHSSERGHPVMELYLLSRSLNDYTYKSDQWEKNFLLYISEDEYH